MERRHFLKLSLIGIIAFPACNNRKDTPIHYLENEVEKKTTLEGEVLHVCPIDGMKMKLRLKDGEIIRVYSADNQRLDKEWYKKKVKLYGKVERMTVPAATIASNFKEKKLLCHIDHTPCADTKWVENRWKDGSAEDLLKRDNKQLLNRMAKSQRNYIQVFSIYAESIEEI